jgi:hypothetical protein
MTISTEERLATIHDQALRDFSQIQTTMKNIRMECLQDRRFYSVTGAQWEGELASQFENKIKFEMNKVHLAVIRIFNEYRNNRITVEFVSKYGESSDDLADACNGLYRADEQYSNAQEAYDNAFEEGVGGGFGAWRLRACYEDEEDEEDDRQRICIEPIYDADSSVFFDLDAKRQDKADAKQCWVLTSMTRGAYKEKYGDDPASWPKSIYQSQYDWWTPDVVMLAEYYKIEDYTKTIRVFRGLDGKEVKHFDQDFKDDPELERELAAKGYKESRQKKVKSKRVHKYLMNGNKIIEDMGIIAGKNIPIVPFYGKRWFVDNVERCMGHVRLAKDAQRLKNMQTSKLGEIAAFSSVRKPIFTPEQMAGHTQMWADDNIKNYPYLLINALTDKDGQPVVPGAVGYAEVPEIPPALGALLQLSEQDMQDLLGNQQAGEELTSNLSGKAVELVQTRLDMQVFIYMSNMAKSIKRSGEIWLSMAKDILIEENRNMKTISEDGDDSGMITLLKPVMDAESGEMKYENDLSEADFDVNVTVGASSVSRRSATVRALTSMLPFMASDPESTAVVVSMCMMNMEGEGVGDVRRYFRKKLVSMGVVEPTEEEAQEIQNAAANQPPDPQAQYLQAAAAQASASADKSRADTVLTVAKAENTRAQTAETLSGIDLAHRNQLLEEVQALGQAVQNHQANIQPIQSTEVRP